MVNMPPITMVIWGMVYGIVLPTLYGLWMFMVVVSQMDNKATYLAEVS